MIFLKISQRKALPANSKWPYVLVEIRSILSGFCCNVGGMTWNGNHKERLICTIYLKHSDMFVCFLNCLGGQIHSQFYF